jgi:uncharacterized RDD family membrane protein YckC
MFTIIGGDGEEYGPASVTQVRAWVAAGRANLRTKARAIGSEEWRELGDFPEFGGPGEVPPMLPPRLPTSGTRPGASVAATNITSAPIDPGTRTGAALINAGIYFVCMMPGSLMMTRKLMAENPELAKGGFPRLEDIDLTGFRDAVIWAWAGLLAAMFVQALLIGFRGQNIGKMLVGARVVRIADDGPVGFYRGAVLRFMLPVMFMMMLNILFPLGLLFVAVDYGFMFRADGRCLHDLIAGTKVVRA